MKVCSQCGSEKPLDDFYRHPKGKHGRSSWCKPCTLEQQREYQSRPDVRERTVLRMRQKALEKYGLTVEDYERMKRQQRGRCAICRKKSDRLDVDHCHRTGQVRGLLCVRCNRMIGCALDDPLVLRRGADYVERSHS